MAFKAMEYKKLDTLIDLATSTNEPIHWSVIMADLMDNKPHDVQKIVQSLSFGDLSCLSSIINDAVITARTAELKDLAERVKALNPSVEELVQIFGSNLSQLSQPAPVNVPPVEVVTAQEKVINELPKSAVAPKAVEQQSHVSTYSASQISKLLTLVVTSKKKLKNGVLATPELNPSNKRCFHSFFPYASDDEKLRKLYIRYLVNRDPDMSVDAVGDEVLKFFSEFVPQFVYSTRSSLKKNEVKPITENPLTKDVKANYKRGLTEMTENAKKVEKAIVDRIKALPTAQPVAKPVAKPQSRTFCEDMSVIERKASAARLAASVTPQDQGKAVKTHRDKKGVSSFSELAALNVEAKPYEQYVVEQKLEEEYIDEELLAELDNQLKYIK